MIIDRLGKLLGEEPVYKPFNINYPGRLTQELGQIFSTIKPGAVFYRMLGLRVLSSYAKDIVDMIPPRSRNLLKKSRSIDIESVDTKDIVFANQIVFAHETAMPWVPEYSFEEVYARVKDSMKEAGYITFEKEKSTTVPWPAP
jgi:hypothetical protein